jgi:low temperature requirement protein LtrA
MTDPAVARQRGRAPLRRRMGPRDRDEVNRSATPLELLFDLCFVVAVAQAADQLHYALVQGHIAEAVVGYGLAFFAIWWAWMNFTWFASAYDTDDVPYRLLTLLQIGGVLLLAAGVPEGFDRQDYTVGTFGYVLMRVAMVTQWLRMAHDHPASRTTALRYAAGIAVVQLGWIALLATPLSWRTPGFVLLAACELAVPIWAVRSTQPTAWQPEHIADRYGLFTLIVLGECVLAATTTLQAAITSSGLSASLAVVAAGGLVLLFALWWSYFDRPAAQGLRTSPRSAFGWGYWHLLVFASLAAVGAGLQVVAETIDQHGRLSDQAAALTLAVPTALFLVTLGLLHSWVYRYRGERAVARFSVTALLVVLAAVATPPLPLALDHRADRTDRRRAGRGRPRPPTTPPNPSTSPNRSSSAQTWRLKFDDRVWVCCQAPSR